MIPVFKADPAAAIMQHAHMAEGLAAGAAVCKRTCCEHKHGAVCFCVGKPVQQFIFKGIMTVGGADKAVGDYFQAALKCMLSVKVLQKNIELLRRAAI